MLEIQDVWKRYYHNANQRPRTLKNAVADRFRYWADREAYWALQGVNLEIAEGQTVGLIGNNGAGKSTLLRLIGGLSRPTRGKITRRGRLGSLLELGAGFSPEFTGRESVITGSIIAGLTRKEALARLEKVVEFAELEDFIDSPLRTYSSGMFVRLAFSTEINLDPDILLVDEVLAVGDMGFQKKCLNHIIGMKEQGKTIIVVSHALEQIQLVCDEVVWLEHGKVRAQGGTQEIIERYKNRVFEKTAGLSAPVAPSSARRLNPVPVLSTGGVSQAETHSTTTATAPARENRTGVQELEFEPTLLYDEGGQPVKKIGSGDPLIVQLNYTVHQPVVEPIFVVTLRNHDGLKCYEVNSQEDGASVGLVEGSHSLNLFLGALPLLPGTYSLSVGAFSQNWEYTYEYLHQTCSFQVDGPTTGSGIVHIPHRWQGD